MLATEVSYSKSHQKNDQHDHDGTQKHYCSEFYTECQVQTVPLEGVLEGQTEKWMSATRWWGGAEDLEEKHIIKQAMHGTPFKKKDPQSIMVSLIP